MIKSLSKLDDMTFNQSVTGSNPVGLTTTLVRNTKKHEVKNIFNILHGTSTKRKMLLREANIYLQRSTRAVSPLNDLPCWW